MLVPRETLFSTGKAGTSTFPSPIVVLADSFHCQTQKFCLMSDQAKPLDLIIITLFVWFPSKHKQTNITFNPLPFSATSWCKTVLHAQIQWTSVVFWWSKSMLTFLDDLLLNVTICNVCKYSELSLGLYVWQNKCSMKIHKHTSTTHHSVLVDHSRDPADVYTFINHSYKQSVCVCVDPVERRALWVTHPDAGSIPNVNNELSQRTTVQPGGGRHRDSLT